MIKLTREFLEKLLKAGEDINSASVKKKDARKTAGFLDWAQERVPEDLRGRVISLKYKMMRRAGLKCNSK